jgi:hypothetical protein
MIKLNKVLSLIIIALVLVSCGKDKDANFTLKGNVKGLKKGVVYLQKEGDSSVVDLDSLVINGQTEFTLQTSIDEPVILYLKLFKNDGAEHYIPFFADKGITEITTTLKSFNYDSEISGSQQQKLLDEYLGIVKQFNNQNLELIEANFNAQIDNDSILSDSLNKQADKLLKRKYAYAIQFAMNHQDSEVAPYLALNEIPSANPVFIDSIYNGLTDKVKNSLYGKKLFEVISTRKVEE